MMDKTIVAVSTAYGEGGIGIVRMSGDRAGEILSCLFRRGAAGARGAGVAEPLAATAFQDRRMYYGYIADPSSGKTIDEVLVVFMRAPRTYTGEDVAEIHCHGSVVSLRRILDRALSLGASLAEPGEFTKRAFLNGRVDLAQADAVIDLIRAKTEMGYTAAIDRLEGRFSRRVNEMRDALTDILAEVIVCMDYPDEDAEERGDHDSARSVEARLAEIKRSLDDLIATADTGKMIRDGIGVAIIGKPNAGKSSLLNALLREDRAIVSATPGTTRDSIDEYVDMEGLPVRLTDTAGLREAETDVEALGVERSKEAMARADVVVLTLDGSRALDAEDREIADALAGRLREERPEADRSAGAAAPAPCGGVMIVINKSDLPTAIDRDDAARLLPGIRPIEVSAKTGKGLGAITDHIVSAVYGGAVKQGESLLVTNAAHKESLTRAAKETEHAGRALRAGEALDFVETDIRAACDALGEITGSTVTEDILDKVFSRFCIGK
ncbi:MAG: tRNA uridine-5-carboxymethylaminomethyl(34) synthesis GTPase MnmE [Clostridiales Family XIII bacterium]|jgi:tRNA modification GTPase|nr:tRNA uridine-5-carboxymethylaminomethyl(34) synthesis GTPase MnmE [Clostridiales Family XIII bacterium]